MTKQRVYEDLYLELENWDEATCSFTVSVPDHDGKGGTTQPTHVNFKDKEDALQDLLFVIERQGQRKDIKSDAVQLGKLLTNLLLPEGEVRNLFLRKREKAGQDGGVRLRIAIPSNNLQLTRIPWEYIYDPDRLDAKKSIFFLAINPLVSIVRHIPLTQDAGSLGSHQSDRLVVAPLMANAKVGNQESLDQELEKRVFKKAFRGFSVDGVSLEWEPLIEGATLEDFETLAVRKPDIFHFSGHGLFDPSQVDSTTNKQTYEGKLAFQKSPDTNEPALATAVEVSQVLKAAGVRIAVLGACDSGRSDGVSSWSGVAPVLVQEGIPAVVAMQYKVVDKAAILFNQGFYNALGAGLSIDEAVSEGRRMMLGVKEISKKDNFQWGIPVLYMRTGQGILFPELTEKKSEMAETLRFVAEEEAKEIAKGADMIGQRLKVTEKSAGKNIYAEYKGKFGVVRGKHVGQEIEI